MSRKHVTSRDNLRNLLQVGETGAGRPLFDWWFVLGYFRVERVAATSLSKIKIKYENCVLCFLVGSWFLK